MKKQLERALSSLKAVSDVYAMDNLRVQLLSNNWMIQL